MGIILCHMIAFLTGFILDLIIGDPYNMPHPIRLIGRMIDLLTTKLLLLDTDKTDSGCFDGEVDRGTDRSISAVSGDVKAQRRRGLLMVIIVCLSTFVVSALIVVGAYAVSAYVGIAVEAVLTCYILAAKSLKTESMKVHSFLERGDIEGARGAVSMIVGRDTDCLDEEGIVKAAVETVAENTSDGVIAPLLYTCVLGPAGGMLYKSINTMDSMVGYHNDRFENFGYAAAKLDDVVNFLPARISAILMILASLFVTECSMKSAINVFRRDRFNHKSPNSAQTESVCAGAMGVRLAGDASYFGQIVHKPFIGDERRKVKVSDIGLATRLMYVTAFLALLLCESLLALLWLLCR